MQKQAAGRKSAITPPLGARSLSLQARPDGVQLAGGPQFAVLVRDKLCVLLDKDFPRRAKIKLGRMVTKVFPMHTSPDETAIGIDVHLGYAQFRGWEVFLLVHAPGRGLELAA